MNRFPSFCPCIFVSEVAIDSPTREDSSEKLLRQRWDYVTKLNIEEFFYYNFSFSLWPFFLGFCLFALLRNCLLSSGHDSEGKGGRERGEPAMISKSEKLQIILVINFFGDRFHSFITVDESPPCNDLISRPCLSFSLAFSAREKLFALLQCKIYASNGNCVVNVGAKRASLH